MLRLPEGSILWTLLCVVYVNDIHMVINEKFIKLFADDTLASVSGNDFNWVIDTLNNEFGIVYNWLCSNRLKLNIDKTKRMVIRSNNYKLYSAEFFSCNT